MPIHAVLVPALTWATPATTRVGNERYAERIDDCQLAGAQRLMMRRSSVFRAFSARV